MWKVFSQEGAAGIPWGPQGACLYRMLCKDSAEITHSLWRSGVSNSCWQTTETQGSVSSTGCTGSTSYRMTLEKHLNLQTVVTDWNLYEIVFGFGFPKLFCVNSLFQLSWPWFQNCEFIFLLGPFIPNCTTATLYYNYIHPHCSMNYLHCIDNSVTHKPHRHAQHTRLSCA